MGKISFLIHRIIMVLSVVVPCMVIIAACSPKIVYLPGQTIVETKDSIITKIDSVEVPLPVEKVVEVAFDYAPLHLETSLAEADIVADTTNRVLRGEIKNKQKSLPVGVPTTEQYHQRDSIVREPYPVEVEKIVKVYPKWLIILAVLGAVCITAELLLFFMKR